MRSLLWLSIVCVVVSVLGQQQCILDNGRFVYKVEVINGCISSTSMGRITPENKETSDLRNNYIVQNDKMEESLLNVKLEHSKMISDLDNRISQLAGIYEKLPHLSESDLRQQASQKLQSQLTVDSKLKIPTRPKRHENILLNNLHDEFSKLRRLLFDTKKKLKATDKLLRSSRRSHTKTKAILTDTIKQLNKTKLGLMYAEEKLEKSEEKNKELLKTLNEKEIELNISRKHHDKTRTILNQTNKQLNKTELELKVKNDLLLDTQQALLLSEKEKEELIHALNEKRKELHSSRREYNDTKFNLDETLIDLNKTKIELENKNLLLNRSQNNIDELEKKTKELFEDLTACETYLNISKEGHTETKAILSETVEKLKRTEVDLEEKNVLISQLMQELKNLTQERDEITTILSEKLKELELLELNHNTTSVLLAKTIEELNKTKLQIKNKNKVLSHLYGKLRTTRIRKKELYNTLSKTSKQLNLTQNAHNKTKNALNERIRQHNKTELELHDTNKQLLNSKEQLSKLEDEKEELVGVGIKRQAELDDVKAQLKQCKKDVKAKVIELWEATSDIDKLKKELENCRTEVKQIKILLERSLIKYHNLNVKHENVTEQLNETHERLLQCFREKVSTYCGFEDPNLCGYTQENGTDELDWIQWSMKTPSDWTGPKGDHTCGNDKGHYMYVEATAMGSGNMAKLLSPKYYGFEEQCVEFYYHMYGKHTGTLNVYLLVDDWDDGELPTPVWRAYGNQGDVWTMARLEIPEEAATMGYKVVFEVMTIAGYAGDIAIDDVRIFDGSCLGTQSIEQWRVYERNNMIDTLRNHDEKLKIKQKTY